jgi:hypothetical protein
MRREATPHSCCGRDTAQLGACRRGRPVASACRAVDDAQQRTGREVGPDVKPGLKLLPSADVQADLATTPALPAPNQT